MDEKKGREKIIQDVKNNFGFKKMSDEDALKIARFEKNSNEGDNHLIELSFDSLIYNGQYMEKTKPVDALLIIDERIVPLNRVTTWAKLLRDVNETVKPYHSYDKVIDEVDDKTWFEHNISDFIKENNLGMNGNFSETLFDDDSYINSKLYLSNQNHKLEVFDYGNNRHICAVYPTEVIVVLYALMCICGGTIFIRYIRKNEIKESINDAYKDNLIDEYEKQILEQVEGIAKVNERIKYNEQDEIYVTAASKNGFNEKSFRSSVLLILSEMYDIGSSLIEFEEKTFEKLKNISIQTDILLKRYYGGNENDREN